MQIVELSNTNPAGPSPSKPPTKKQRTSNSPSRNMAKETEEKSDHTPRTEITKADDITAKPQAKQQSITTQGLPVTAPSAVRSVAPRTQTTVPPISNDSDMEDDGAEVAPEQVERVEKPNEDQPEIAVLEESENDTEEWKPEEHSSPSDDDEIQIIPDPSDKGKEDKSSSYDLCFLLLFF